MRINIEDVLITVQAMLRWQREMRIAASKIDAANLNIDIDVSEEQFEMLPDGEAELFVIVKDKKMGIRLKKTEWMFNVEQHLN